MSDFNSYSFISDLQEEIKQYCDTTDEDCIRDYIEQECERACIYYSNCFSIVSELQITDWSDLCSEFGEITDITTLAFHALSEYTFNEIDIAEIVNEATEIQEKIEELECEIQEIEEEIKDHQDEIDDIQADDGYEEGDDSEEQDVLNVLKEKLDSLKEELNILKEN